MEIVLNNEELRLSDKKASLSFFSDDSADLKVKADAILLTKPSKTSSETIIIDGPGEYEIAGATVTGIEATDYKEQKPATVYLVNMDGLSIALCGKVAAKLNNDQMESLGTVDVLAVQTGDGTSSASPAEASSLIGQIEPKVIIPLGETSGLLSELGSTAQQVSRLKISPKDLPAETTVVVL